MTSNVEFPQLHIQWLCNLLIGFEEAVNLTTKIGYYRDYVVVVVVLEEFIPDLAGHLLYCRHGMQDIHLIKEL